MGNVEAISQGNVVITNELKSEVAVNTEQSTNTTAVTEALASGSKSVNASEKPRISFKDRYSPDDLFYSGLSIEDFLSNKKKELADKGLSQKNFLKSFEYQKECFNSIDTNKDGLLDEKEICDKRDQKVKDIRKERKRCAIASPLGLAIAIPSIAATTVVGEGILCGLLCCVSIGSLLAAGLATALLLSSLIQDSPNKMQQETNEYRQKYLNN